jgi:DNA-binding NtrC family response regulator
MDRLIGDAGLGARRNGGDMRTNEMNLLVIEDEEQVARMIVRCLRRKWKSITVATSTDAGISEIKTGKYDIVLSDLDCPTKDSGYRVVEMSPIPVVLHTGDSKAHYPGAQIVYKPADINDIFSALIRAYEGSNHAVKRGSGKDC